jgi:hypothetical protein
MSLVKRAPESGVCLKRVPYLVVVGVSNETAVACEAACELAHIAFLRFATSIAACPAIHAATPTVVVITSTLFTDEKLAVKEAARLVGARVIELPELMSTATARAEAIVRTVLRESAADAEAEAAEAEAEAEAEADAEAESGPHYYFANIA